MWTVYTQDGMTLEEEVTDQTTRQTYTQLVEIPATVFENLKATVKIDITPKSAFDKYARELSLENLLKAGFFSAQKVGETRHYAEALPDDATMPKQEVLDICDKIEEEQRKIAEINARAQIMQQKAMQFLNEDAEAQAGQISAAQLAQNVNNQVPA